MSNKKFETILNKKQVYATGATRDSQVGKGRYDLIPTVAIKRLAGVYERGCPHHGDRNWEKGVPFSRLYDSAKRHLDQAIEAYWNPDLRDEDHLGHAMWNICAIMFEEMGIERKFLPEGLNDLPKYQQLDGLSAPAPRAEETAQNNDGSANSPTDSKDKSLYDIRCAKTKLQKLRDRYVKGTITSAWFDEMEREILEEFPELSEDQSLYAQVIGTSAANSEPPNDLSRPQRRRSWCDNENDSHGDGAFGTKSAKIFLPKTASWHSNIRKPTSPVPFIVKNK